MNLSECNILRNVLFELSKHTLNFLHCAEYSDRTNDTIFMVILIVVCFLKFSQFIQCLGFILYRGPYKNHVDRFTKYAFLGALRSAAQMISSWQWLRVAGGDWGGRGTDSQNADTEAAQFRPGPRTANISPPHSEHSERNNYNSASPPPHTTRDLTTIDIVTVLYN